MPCNTAWAWLGWLGFAPPRSRPRRREANPKAQETFKKPLPRPLEVPFALVADRDLEHRLGLESVYRRVWAPRGGTPVAWVQPRYRWLYVYTFVHPNTGASEFWLLPSVGTEAFSEVLRRFARLRGAGEDRLVLVVLDRAGWHGSKRLEVPRGGGLVLLPLYFPELQPEGRFWLLVGAAVASGQVRDGEEPEDGVAERGVWLQIRPDLLYRWPGGC